MLLPRPDERVRTALSDPSRIGVVAFGVSAALVGGGGRLPSALVPYPAEGVGYRG
ncbi:hypothetical protein GCM10010298_57060 [Streptomyces microflavus]|nr:hypothetical protein GCM10010298_57060 [Streptomyces microflavus]